MKLVSLIIPCYNEEKNILLFYNEFKKILNSNYNYELIFVNDGSTDNTMDSLNDLLKYCKCKIKIIDFSRNFGKESAMYAGIRNSNGDYAVFIDADLQQNPKYILEMLKVVEKEKCDSVVCYQEKRQENVFKKVLKNIFYKIYNKNSDTYFQSNASDFRLINKKIINNIKSIKEKKRFSKGIFSYVGYKVTYIPYHVDNRQYGKTKWSIKKLFTYAIDGIYSFTKIPLKIINIFANIFLISFIIQLIVNIINKSFTGSSLLYLIIFLISYIFMNAILIVGKYMYNIYQEVLNRPVYIINSIIENGDNNEFKN